MHKRVIVDDAVTVTIETRAGGRVRLGLDHPVIDLQRATMDPVKALEIAQAMLQAGHAAAMVQLTNTGAGAQVEPPQRAWPVPMGHPQGGGVRWAVLAVIAGNAAVWAAFGMLVVLASGG
jgi:hypothetical protein